MFVPDLVSSIFMDVVLLVGLLVVGLSTALVAAHICYLLTRVTIRRLRYVDAFRRFLWYHHFQREDPYPGDDS